MCNSESHEEINKHLHKKVLYIYIYIYVSLYLYVADECSLLPKYKDCTTYNDFELYLVCCGVTLLLLIIYIYIHSIKWMYHTRHSIKCNKHLSTRALS